jgi:hypothetical protein|tara:strand:+ start:146 stop:313 length:168 start_codon:yes stop_codon:yes gene_type:complete
MDKQGWLQDRKEFYLELGSSEEMAERLAQRDYDNYEFINDPSDLEDSIIEDRGCL